VDVKVLFLEEEKKIHFSIALLFILIKNENVNTVLHSKGINTMQLFVKSLDFISVNFSVIYSDYTWLHLFLQF